MASNKRGLGRGLSALIPDEEMDALSDVTREPSLLSGVGAKIDKVAAIGRQVGDSSRRPKKGELKKTGFVAPAAAQRADVQGEITADNSEKAKPAMQSKDAFSVLVNSISANPFQPRRTFDEEELAELAASIDLHGILQPILVRPTPSGEEGAYQLVAGERRWRAAQKAGLEHIPVIVRPMADQQALELALIENVQRHDISAIDAAIAYRRLATDFTLSQEQIARRVGKSRSAVANTIRLLDLPEAARKAIENGEITEGHGRAILLAAGEGTRRALLRRILRDKLSVREVENLARKVAEESIGDQTAGRIEKAPFASDSKNDAWLQAEQDCTKKLGVRVKVKVASRRNVILIECGTLAELQRVLALMQNKL